MTEKELEDCGLEIINGRVVILLQEVAPLNTIGWQNHGTAIGAAAAVWVRRQAQEGTAPHDFEAEIDDLKGVGLLDAGDVAVTPKELRRDAITLLQELGSGEYGVVLHALYRRNTKQVHELLAKLTAAQCRGPAVSHALQLASAVLTGSAPSAKPCITASAVLGDVLCTDRSKETKPSIRAVPLTMSNLVWYAS